VIGIRDIANANLTVQESTSQTTVLEFHNFIKLKVRCSDKGFS